MRPLCLFALSLALTGCADSHQWIPQQQALAPLPKEQQFYISTPLDGTYGSHTYNGSGRNTAQIIQAALSRHVRSVRIGHQANDYNHALAAARDAGQDILVFPTILHWEDRATEWSMIPDQVEIKLEVVRVLSGDVVNTAIIKGKSGIATLGGDHPQDLLPEPVGEFVATLFQGGLQKP